MKKIFLSSPPDYATHPPRLACCTLPVEASPIGSETYELALPVRDANPVLDPVVLWGYIPDSTFPFPLGPVWIRSHVIMQGEAFPQRLWKLVRKLGPVFFPNLIFKTM